MNRIRAAKNPCMSEREIKNQNRMRELASQGMVLLENKGVLPFPEAVKKIALYGTGARHTVKGGTGSGDVNSRNIVNIEQGLQNAGYIITTKKWLDCYDEKLDDAYRKWAEKGAEEINGGLSPLIYLMEKSFKAPASQPVTDEDVAGSDTDTAVYVISRNSGEGADRYDRPGDYQLSQEEERDLSFLAESYEYLTVLLNVGGIIDTKFLRNTPGIGAVLLVSQAGNISGDAVADVLSGKVNPSGKLTDTWAENYKDYPLSDEFSHNNGNLDDAYYKDGIYVGYRYFDTFNITPAYCFGYGKSYTQFSITAKKFAADEEQVCVAVEVKNTGLYRGKEVVQVYYSAPDGKLEKPYQELAAFGKTKLLEPGEAETIELHYPTTAMASYCEKSAAWTLEPGIYYIRVGNSSRNTCIAGAVKVEQEAVTEKVKNLFLMDCPVQEISSKGIQSYTYQKEEQEKLAAEKTAVCLKQDKIQTHMAIYREECPEQPNQLRNMERTLTLEEVKEGTCTLDELTAQMSVKELTMLCVGKIKEGFSAIGSAGTVVPGSAGETTDAMVKSRKIPSLILADGPAGLRLTKEFQVDAQGNIGDGGGFEFPEVMRKAIRNAMSAVEIGEPQATYYQYCTAIPVATLLAQSWDMDLIEECGDIVGEEMEEFGVNLWLAPGMNIHRNPLCGRNFEYYSEDPLLSGKCAAADTRGVQKHQGAGTTIKHFVTNNQEDNRSFENNHVTERALREIYLKGFEICVKEAQPASVMTSYNLLNGVHTANRYDLLTSALRDEWGFEGFVMTDWGTTGSMALFNHEPVYPSSSPAMCIQAGNDMIMPGMKEDIEDILNSVDAEEEKVFCPLRKKELQECAKNILKVMMRLIQ